VPFGRSGNEISSDSIVDNTVQLLNADRQVHCSVTIIKIDLRFVYPFASYDNNGCYNYICVWLLIFFKAQTLINENVTFISHFVYTLSYCQYYHDAVDNGIYIKLYVILLYYDEIQY